MVIWPSPSASFARNQSGRPLGSRSRAVKKRIDLRDPALVLELPSPAADEEELDDVELDDVDLPSPVAADGSVEKAAGGDADDLLDCVLVALAVSDGGLTNPMLGAAGDMPALDEDELPGPLGPPGPDGPLCPDGPPL